MSFKYLANWKMNPSSLDEAETLANIYNQLPTKALENLTTFVPNIYLQHLKQVVSQLHIGAQDVSEFISGAYTGQVSCGMLSSIGVQRVLIGHSESRGYFHQNNLNILKKVEACLESGFEVTFCVGFEEQIKLGSINLEVLKTQLTEGLLPALERFEKAKVNIAYEPVWAINTGVVATKEDITKVNKYISEILSDALGFDRAGDVSLLYGGSVNANNAPELLQAELLDGFLFGKASLDGHGFVKTIELIQEQLG